ncbi:hypothetical protein [Nocardia asiatica]|uniref:hypothetical protein n=1 Tax=Nocardia asiatica TaxID=209252 RepID=UPI0002E88808|nr:hypothetical protein [Nocardia asiatica]
MDIDTELKNYLGEKRKLIETMTDAFRHGTPANEIARRVAPAFGRDMVKQYLGNVGMADDARDALTRADLASAVGVSVSGIDAPRQVTLAATADPTEIPDYPSLPERLRTALHPYHLTLDLPLGKDHDHPTDATDLDTTIDQLLLEGEPVRLVRTKPLTTRPRGENR